jgi:hypothetical protein
MLKAIVVYTVPMGTSMGRIGSGDCWADIKTSTHTNTVLHAAGRASIHLTNRVLEHLPLTYHSAASSTEAGLHCPGHAPLIRICSPHQAAVCVLFLLLLFHTICVQNGAIPLQSSGRSPSRDKASEAVPSFAHDRRPYREHQPSLSR